MESKELLLRLLEERLLQHDNNRKDVQNQVQDLCDKVSKEVDFLEEKINGELRDSFSEIEERTLYLIEKLSSKKEEENKDLETFIGQAKEELLYEQSYKIEHLGGDDFVYSYCLKVTTVPVAKRRKFDNDDECNPNGAERIINHLKDHLKKAREHMVCVQNELTKICNNKRNEVKEMKITINAKLEPLFVQEDSRIQKSVSLIKEKNVDDEIISKVKMTLLKIQKYSFKNDTKNNNYDIIIKREAHLKIIDFEKRKPTKVALLFTDKGELLLSFSFFNEDEIIALKEIGSNYRAIISIQEKSKNGDDIKIITKEYIIGEQSISFTDSFFPRTTYFLKVKIGHHNDLSSEWSDIVEFVTPEFEKLCIWKKCPDSVHENMKYAVDANNFRIATNISWQCTIVGNTYLPPNKVTSWSIKILKSQRNNGSTIFIGVAPYDIDQSDCLCNCGWYFYCCNSTLRSGPPHGYKNKEYGPRKGRGKYVHNGDPVGVVMDTIKKSELSFVLNGVNLGIAYEGIPLDKPLVPCVIFWSRDDSVELILN